MLQKESSFIFPLTKYYPETNVPFQISNSQLFSDRIPNQEISYTEINNSQLLAYIRAVSSTL